MNPKLFNITTVSVTTADGESVAIKDVNKVVTNSDGSISVYINIGNPDHMGYHNSYRIEEEFANGAWTRISYYYEAN